MHHRTILRNSPIARAASVANVWIRVRSSRRVDDRGCKILQALCPKAWRAINFDAGWDRVTQFNELSVVGRVRL
jgi:hypothetical protein